MNELVLRDQFREQVVIQHLWAFGEHGTFLTLTVTRGISLATSFLQVALSVCAPREAAHKLGSLSPNRHAFQCLNRLPSLPATASQ